ncbi:MAG: SurA N-terminal domain-containing protein [Chloroflexi bacterium]|nr:SurA N-terminal domain-containing protein [Chloroflexota bacterium]MEB2366848.1 SurA N-terminal domain-containing protein [Chloroflexota bacterium]
MSRLIAVLMCAVAVGLAACAGQAAPPILGETTSTENLPDVVARVNGQDITRDEYERAVARLSPAGAIAQQVSNQVLDALIEQALIEQAAVELGITVDEADIDTEINALKALTTDWDAWLTDNGYTEADFRSALYSNLLTQRVRDAVLLQSGEVEAIRTVHARHILLASQDEAQAVSDRLANGEMFEALAAELSRDVTTKDVGGDLGFFVRTDLTTPQLADLAFSLEPGETSGPVQTALGWHIVQTLEFGERPLVSGEEAIAQEQRFIDWLMARRQAATIERLF